jgi:hypothetical protein
MWTVPHSLSKRSSRGHVTQASAWVTGTDLDAERLTGLPQPCHTLGRSEAGIVGPAEGEAAPDKVLEPAPVG